MKPTWILLIAITACGKKKEKDAAPPPPPPLATIDAAAAALPTPEAVKLTAGQETELGCIGWSIKLEAAACFNGTTGAGVDHDVELRYVGAGAKPMKVAETLDDKVVTAANAYLTEHAFTTLTPGAILATGKPITIDGATFAWKRAETAPGGDNQPPTYKDELTITCSDGKTDPMVWETEGGDLELTLHDQGTRVLLVKNMHVGREGESSNTVDAMLVNTKQCATVRE